jgi:predicted ATPase
VREDLPSGTVSFLFTDVAGSTRLSVCDAKLSELSALVDFNVLKPIADERLLMLETIREYGLERLAESGEEETFRARHAKEFARLAEAAYARRGEAEAEWSARLDRDHDDLRARGLALAFDDAVALALDQ